MIIERQEFGADYEHYRFGYSIWCRPEPGDSLQEIYAAGFLPYSGGDDQAGSFYMARSLRVDLTRFALNSENRRVLKKVDRQLFREAIAFPGFDHSDPAFRGFCHRYFLARHGMDLLANGKLEAILNSGLIDRIVRYRDAEGRPVAFVILVGDEAMSHYWFSFYDPELARDSIGMWLMIREAQEAQALGRQAFYLGTCYSSGSLYKTNLGPLQWWDGTGWTADVKRLKALARGE